MRRIVLLKCLRKSQRKRGREESEQEEETKVPKRTARGKLNEELNDNGVPYVEREENMAMSFVVMTVRSV